MRINRPAIVVASISQANHWKPSLEPFVEAPPLNWNAAVRAAAARLNEGFGLPDPLNDPVVVALAQQLAVLLCAYGQVGGEVQRMCRRDQSSTASESGQCLR